jgi:hypothetical protein
MYGVLIIVKYVFLSIPKTLLFVIYLGEIISLFINLLDVKGSADQNGLRYEV